MKLPMLFLLSFWILSLNSDARTIELNGAIKCAETNKSISDAFLRVGEYFTYSNEEGEFILKVPAELVDKLEVYHFGYKAFVYELNKNDNNIDLHDIFLEKANTKPAPVADGGKIMSEVFKRIHANYELEDQLILAYCKESLSSSQSIQHFAEGVLEIHVPSNVDKGPTLVRPIKTRIRSDLKNEGVIQMSGLASEMVRSWALNNFLSKKYRWDYIYRLVGNDMYRGENVFVIDFLPFNNHGNVQGRLWIDAFTFAIIRIEYQLLKSMMWESESWIEEFQHYKHTYYLSKSTFEGKWEENGESYVFNTMVINTNIKADQENKISFNKFIPDYKFSFVENSRGSFSDDYWDKYNYVKLTQLERMFLDE